MIEMFVASVQRQIVLQHQRGEPDIVRRNRCALFPELMKDGGVMVGRLIVGKQHVHTILQEKLPESSLVVRVPTTVNESGSQFAELLPWTFCTFPREFSSILRHRAANGQRI